MTTKLQWYARKIVALACALITSSVWLFFNTSNLIFLHINPLNFTLLIISVATTTLLYYELNTVKFQAEIYEGTLKNGLEHPD
jgi:hypothetical protein